MYIYVFEEQIESKCTYYIAGWEGKSTIEFARQEFSYWVKDLTR